MPHPASPPPQTQVDKQTLHDGSLLQIGYITVRPASPGPGEVEAAERHVLALPLAGVFAKHDGRAAPLLATPLHGLFISAGLPYRLSFPGCVGDRCLALRLSSEGLARALPQAQRGEGFDADTFAPQAPLPAALQLARNALTTGLRRAELEPLEAEELGLALLTASLAAARRVPLRQRGAGAKAGLAPGAAAGLRRARPVWRTQEAVWAEPGRDWTLSALAEQACVSASHLSHAFRRETGSTVYGYVLRARLARALDAVLDSDLALTRIALDHGFSSHSHFTARFRHCFGHTPQALRQSAGVAQVRELRRNLTARQPGGT